jgi:hypothetical protein
MDRVEVLRWAEMVQNCVSCACFRVLERCLTGSLNRGFAGIRIEASRAGINRDILLYVDYIESRVSNLAIPPPPPPCFGRGLEGVDDLAQ